MATLILRDLKPLPEAEGLYRRWISHLNEQFTLHTSPDRRAEVVRDELYQIYLGHSRRGGRANAGVKSHPDVRFTYGYNLAVGDNCRIRRGAVLDDSGGEVVIPEGTIIEPGTTFPPAARS